MPVEEGRGGEGRERRGGEGEEGRGGRKEEGEEREEGGGRGHVGAVPGYVLISTCYGTHPHWHAANIHALVHSAFCL